MTQQSRPAHRRRSLTKIGAATAVGGALALSMASGLASPADAATTKSLNYKCGLPDLGINFTDPWKVVVAADLPTQVDPGASLPAPKVDATVTTGADAAAQLRALNVKTIKGTSPATYTVSGAVENPGTRTANLTIPLTNVPATGNIVTKPSGVGAAEKAAATAGTATATVGNFKAALTTDSGFVANVVCTQVAGQDATLAKITVGDAPTQSPTSTATPTESPTSTSSPTDTGTGTAEPTGTGTVTGPPVQTDFVQDGSGNSTAAIAGLVTLGGVVGAGVVARRRMKG
ncbi:DUF6801 domain-containing protein [Luteipulveratus mongoliensis]|uniref:DUF6801 domain-containing protein n=1 Tax=Luteipulveratus mongoliensis TaxID=571913 RepID=A0A0K1JNB2_9MICO|nr:DUF6801 domain-containing protein [Luteipulveratus mongoliensis]AKU18080.1 hypothetical protein VV02_23125 [Luteipulveratus mongoliensis]